MEDTTLDGKNIRNDAQIRPAHQRQEGERFAKENIEIKAGK